MSDAEYVCPVWHGINTCFAVID